MKQWSNRRKPAAEAGRVPLSIGSYRAESGEQADRGGRIQRKREEAFHPQRWNGGLHESRQEAALTSGTCRRAAQSQGWGWTPPPPYHHPPPPHLHPGTTFHSSHRREPQQKKTTVTDVQSFWELETLIPKAVLRSRGVIYVCVCVNRNSSSSRLSTHTPSDPSCWFHFSAVTPDVSLNLINYPNGFLLLMPVSKSRIKH